MEKIYALIKDNLIVNTIKADEDFCNLIRNEYQEIIDITYTIPVPSIGWSFFENSFIPPATETPEINFDGSLDSINIE